MWGQDLIPPNGDFCVFLEAIEQGNLFIFIISTSEGNVCTGTIEGWEWLRILYISVREIWIFKKGNMRERWSKIRRQQHWRKLDSCLPHGQRNSEEWDFFVLCVLLSAAELCSISFLIWQCHYITSLWFSCKAWINANYFASLKNCHYHNLAGRFSSHIL